MKVIARYDTEGETYIRVKLEDGRVIREHRHVMEEHLGRKLQPEEVVHHLDENPRNNKIENLVLRSRAQHVKDHKNLAETVEMVCPICGERFERTLRYVRSKQRTGQKSFLCGRSCRLPRGSKPTQHGTRSGYLKGCRCDECRKANTEAHRAYRRGR